MNFKQCVILLVVATLKITSVASLKESAVSVEAILARSSTNECFSNYLQQANVVIAKYKELYSTCDQKSQQEMQGIQEAFLDKRNSLALTVNKTCSALSHCHALESTEESFDCFMKEASQNVKTMNNIYTNASKSLINLREECRLIKNRAQRCTSDTKEQFDNEIALHNTVLTECMMQGI